MRRVRGLTIIVATADAERFAAALTIASAGAALGARTRLYCHGRAVTLLARGEPLDTALELGVAFIACQSALAEAAMTLPDFAEGGGMVSLLATLDDDRLVTV